MSQTWSSLFFQTSNHVAVAEALQAMLQAQGYQPYDPFPGGTGTPPGWSEWVRQFVAPAREGWVRVLGDPVEAILPDLSRRLGLTIIHGWLRGEESGFTLYEGWTQYADPDAFGRYRRPGQSMDNLRRAWAGELPVAPVENAGPPVVTLGPDALPSDIRQLAEDKGIDADRASSLFERLSDSLFGKLARGSDTEAAAEQDQARALLAGSGQDIWNSLPGQRVRAVTGVLALPDTWRTPDWEAVRDAYHVHRLRERSPRMPLMPGDQEALQAVPDALSYRPVYMGKA